MALEAGSSGGSGGNGRGWGSGFRSLMRRKQVDSDRVRAEGQPQLAKELNVPELVAIGAFGELYALITRDKLLAHLPALKMFAKIAKLNGALMVKKCICTKVSSPRN